MSKPYEPPPDIINDAADEGLILETAPNAAEQLRAFQTSMLGWREAARLAASGVPLNEAIKTAKALEQGDSNA